MTSDEDAIRLLEELIAKRKSEPYPVTIFPARYQGTYEGGRWIALNEYSNRRAVSMAQGDDITCMDFFELYEKPIGRGNSPQEAYDSLVEEMKDES